MKIEDIRHWIILKRQFIALGATDDVINTDVAEKMMLLNQLMEFIDLREAEQQKPGMMRLRRLIGNYLNRIRLFFVKKQIESKIIQSIDEWNKKAFAPQMADLSTHFKSGYEVGYSNAIRMILQIKL